jgi:hypothetical protein
MPCFLSPAGDGKHDQFAHTSPMRRAPQARHRLRMSMSENNLYYIHRASYYNLHNNQQMHEIEYIHNVY